MKAAHPRPWALRARPALVLWHRYIGLAAGMWLLLLAMTGIILVFYEESDQALNPGLFMVAAPAGVPAMPLNDVIEKVHARYPESYARAIFLPADMRHPIMLTLARRVDDADENDKPVEVFVHPYTGAILGDRVFGKWKSDPAHIMPFIYELHTSLQLGPLMETILGIAGLFWAVVATIGVMLALPPRTKWAKSFIIPRKSRGYKFILDSHRAAGLWLLPVTLVVAVTGAYFNLPNALQSVIAVFSQPAPQYVDVRPNLPQPLYQPQINIDQAIDIARTAIGPARLDMIVQDTRKGLYRLKFAHPKDVGKIGENTVDIDMTTGRLVAVFHPAEGNAADIIAQWHYPLHSGKAFGWYGRLLVLLSGLVACLSIVTGIQIWMRKKNSQRR